MKQAIDENESSKEQISAMDEITVTLTRENLEKQEAIERLREESERQIMILQAASEESVVKRQELIAKLEAKNRDLVQSHEQTVEALKASLCREKEAAIN